MKMCCFIGRVFIPVLQMYCYTLTFTASALLSRSMIL
jgi:hypothetical protein